MLKKFGLRILDLLRLPRPTPRTLPKPEEPMPFDADRVAELIETGDVEHFEEIAWRMNS